ncbi:MAG TPA: class I SAM-dependent methyltransferase [Solirubrobacteraceae bacterium]|nr:class I SAM-dependent methyltransferase [Solirubrobacteraceae bacterium]
MPRLVDEINALEPDWHGRGSVPPSVVEALNRHIDAYGEVAHSVETGAGRTTLLLSHRSRDHVVFTIDDGGDGDSLRRVRESPLLDAASTRFVLGPSQRTILAHEFPPLDLAYLDGPHAYPFPELEYWAVYPHLKPGALLVLDDVQIPTLANMYEFLRADRMYDELEVVDDCAFFRRTTAPALDPYGEGWWLQDYNRRRSSAHLTPRRRAAALVKRATPQPVKELVKARVRER